MERFTLQKKERLKSRKALAELFKQGRSFAVYPIRVYYHPVRVMGENPGFKCAFSVPKRIHRKAVHRNQLKRLMREAYRLNRNHLASHMTKSSLNLLLLYYGPEKLTFKQIEKATLRILRRLDKELSPNHD